MIWKSLNAIIVAILIRIFIATYPYFDESNKSSFEFFDANKQWMKITTSKNISINEWYSKFQLPQNSKENIVKYCPPLKAYFSWINGKMAQNINPKIFEGKRNSNVKIFMRWTILIADFVFYFPTFALAVEEELNDQKKVIQWLSMCIQPVFLLIEHAHFKDDSVSLSLSLLSFIMLMENHHKLSSFIFALALGFDSRIWVFALPYFSIVIGNAFFVKTTNLNQKGKEIAKKEAIKYVFFVISIFILTLIILWIPFIRSFKDFLQIILNLFSFQKEPQVCIKGTPNLWFILNDHFKSSLIPLKKISFAITLLITIPINYNVIKKPSRRSFILSLFNTSFAFFLFAFPNHCQIDIVIPLLISTFLIQDQAIGFFMFWFIIVSAYSIFPLVLIENLVIPYYFSLIVFALLSAKIVVFNFHFPLSKFLFASSILFLFFNQVIYFLVFSHQLKTFLISLIQFVSFIHFVLFWIFFVFHQFKKEDFWFLMIKREEKNGKEKKDLIKKKND
ncbi:dolichyl pyrophosphate man9glcnac2 alpha-13-glucosyltransferase [Anaeramoeba ignava]|uniref:Alpha-1,3-glucosyltransferase n=1 Tax=Anaeramoeba ignava TaxID=1746090 RepID=A0A9Q0RBX8_ANAIG|nr:dolichyl pyrophosphate man9glcnac2 alpha-13-glucosyltransferase [Anaeramoeba ignava]